MAKNALGKGLDALLKENKDASEEVAVLSMHAPWEITSKEDISQIFECYKAFLKL